MIYASTVDLEEAYRVGQKAAQIAVEDGSGYMSTILRKAGPIYNVRYDKVPLEMVANCECELGCPSCIHFPTCGAGNVPLDKAGCVHLLEVFTGRRDLDLAGLPGGGLEDEPPLFADWEDEEEQEDEAPQDKGPRIVVFDHSLSCRRQQPRRQQQEVGLGQGGHVPRLAHQDPPMARLGGDSTLKAIHWDQCLRPPTLPLAPSQTAMPIFPSPPDRN